VGAAPPSGVVGRFLRLHAFELLIFGIMFILLAICLAAAPLVTETGGDSGALRAGAL